MRVLHAAIPLAAAVLALAAPARAADTVIAEELRAAPVTAHGDAVAWSSFQPATGRYVLRAAVGAAAPVTLPVAALHRPFDVDLGPDARGRLVAVYSRCRREPPVTDGGPPDFRRARGCDLFRYDFARRAEARLRGLSTRAGSEFLPSAWRGRVAFARLARAGGPGARLHAGRPGSAEARRLPGGTRTPELDVGPGDQPRPLALDLRGQRLAFAWGDVSGRGRCRPYTEKPGVLPAVSEIWTTTLGGRRALAERGCANDPLRAFSSPSLGPLGLVYRVEGGGAYPDDFFRLRRLAGAQVGDARGPVGLLSVAQGDAALFAVRRPSFQADRFEVLRVDTPGFAPAAAQRRTGASG